MTNKNSRWNSAETLRCPFLLKPIGKNYLWGGNRLNDDFSKEIDLSPLAETWALLIQMEPVLSMAENLMVCR